MVNFDKINGFDTVEVLMWSVFVTMQLILIAMVVALCRITETIVTWPLNSCNVGMTIMCIYVHFAMVPVMFFLDVRLRAHQVFGIMYTVFVYLYFQSYDCAFDIECPNGSLHSSFMFRSMTMMFVFNVACGGVKLIAGGARYEEESKRK